MKALLRRLLSRFGLAVRHLASDPVLACMDTNRELLRLHPRRSDLWLHTLSQLALTAHLRELLHLHAPDLVVDVGANHGQFALQIRALGYAGPIVSLEPQRALATALQERAAQSDPAWVILHGAAGQTRGSSILQTFADDTFSSIHHPTPAAQERFGALLASVASEAITIRTIEEWLADTPHAACSRIFLKTDTQGHDLAVLQGAPLGRCCVVLAEASLVPVYDVSASPADLTAIVATAGLRPAGFYAVSHDRHDLAALEIDCLFTRAPR